MRKLASIRKIIKLIPIKGADRIELAQVDGWFCIVKKDEFKVGDLGVYFEIDSLLPYAEPYLFLGKPKNYKGVEGYRIRTMKMRGVLSQGLLLPLHYFEVLEDTEEGLDVTETLGITKYEPRSFNGNNGGKSGISTAKPFPSFIPKTDQERIQNVTDYFNTYKDEEFEETLKLDGSSYTAYKINEVLPLWKRTINCIYPMFSAEKFAVCSRNLELKDESHKGIEEMSNFWKVTLMQKIEDRLPLGYAIQGELIAPNIQSNHERVTAPELHIFDVYDIINQRYLLPKERIAFLKEARIVSIPVVNPCIKIFTVCPELTDLLYRVEGPSLHKDTDSEGRVYKSTTSSLSFKVISNKYLLKEK